MDPAVHDLHLHHTLTVGKQTVSLTRFISCWIVGLDLVITLTSHKRFLLLVPHVPV